MDHYYEEIPGWFLEDDADFYRHLVANLVPDGGTIVEVGCWKGRSLSCLLVNAKNSGKNIRIVGVDTFEGSTGQPMMLACAEHEDVEAICRANAGRADYPFELVRASSVEAAKLFKDSSLDAVYLDAAHDYESVSADFAAWTPKLKDTGVMAGHDATETGVAMALMDWAEKPKLWVLIDEVKEVA